MAGSSHLDEIIQKHHHVANLQVVFLDIEKYSKRRTKTQTEVIDEFTLALKESLKATSKEYVEYAQTNNVNFQSDIITIPTGDGAAVVFTFTGLSEIHLYFASSILKYINETNGKTPCDKFEEQGWCNCHTNYGVRVGISQDNGILYKDINENYNVAGNVINMAARVMGLAEKNQIIFTREAYKQIIDMVDDPNLVDRFKEFAKVRLKHGLEENVYQYIGQGEKWISTEPPEQLALMIRADNAMERMPMFTGFNRQLKEDRVEGLGKMVGAMEAIGKLFSDIESGEKAFDVKASAVSDASKSPDEKL